MFPTAFDILPGNRDELYNSCPPYDPSAIASGLSSPLSSPPTSVSSWESSPAPPSPPISRSTPKRPAKKSGRRRRPGHVARPPNSFILYRSYFHKEVHNLETHGSKISAMAAKSWKRESEAAKAYWTAQAAAVKAKFVQEHPGWTFKPNKNKKPPLKRKTQPPTSAQKEKMEVIVSAFSIGKRDQELEALVINSVDPVDPPPPYCSKPSRKADSTKRAQAKKTSTKTKPAAPNSERAPQPLTPDTLPSTESVAVETPSSLLNVSAIQQELEPVSQNFLMPQDTSYEQTEFDSITAYFNNVTMNDGPVNDYPMDPLDQLFGEQQPLMDVDYFGPIDYAATDYFLF